MKWLRLWRTTPTKAKAQQAALWLGIGIATVIGTLVARHMDLGGSFQTEVKKVVVLVCPENLKAGTLFTRSPMGGGYGRTMPFIENQFPADIVPEDAIRTYAELEGQRLLKPLKPFQFVTRRDLMKNAVYMAKRTETVTLDNVSVAFNAEWNVLVLACSILSHEKGWPPFVHGYHQHGTGLIHHGLFGYIRFLKLHQENRAADPPRYGTTLVDLEGVFAYICLVDARIGPDWWVKGPTYQVSIKVTPEEAQAIAQAQKKGINLCYLGREPRMPLWKRYRSPGPMLYFWDELCSGMLIW